MEDIVAIEGWPFRDQVWQGDPPGFCLGGFLAPAGEPGGSVGGDLDEAFVKFAVMVIRDLLAVL